MVWDTELPWDDKLEAVIVGVTSTVINGFKALKDPVAAKDACWEWAKAHPHVVATGVVTVTALTFLYKKGYSLNPFRLCGTTHKHKTNNNQTYHQETYRYEKVEKCEVTGDVRADHVVLQMPTDTDGHLTLRKVTDARK